MPSLGPGRSAARLRAIANRKLAIGTDLRELANDLEAKKANVTGRRLKQMLSTYRVAVRSPFGRVYRLLKDSAIRR